MMGIVPSFPLSATTRREPQLFTVSHLPRHENLVKSNESHPRGWGMKGLGEQDARRRNESTAYRSWPSGYTNISQSTSWRLLGNAQSYRAGIRCP